MPVRVTKHRPLWSDRCKWAAALACGLCCLILPATVAAEITAQKGTPSKVAPKTKKKAEKGVAVKKTPSLKKSGKSRQEKSRHPVAGRAVERFGMAEMRAEDEVGLRGSASFYGQSFQGRRAATGERFDMRAFTAASNRFPLGSWVAVQRLDNGRCAIVKVNDRMHARHERRIIDVSRSVANYLDMIRAGVVMVRVAPLKSAERAAQHCRSAFEGEDGCPDCRPTGVTPDLKSARDFPLP